MKIKFLKNYKIYLKDAILGADLLEENLEVLIKKGIIKIFKSPINKMMHRKNAKIK